MQTPPTTESTQQTESIPEWFRENDALRAIPPQPKKRFPKKYLIIAGVIVLILVAGGLIYMTVGASRCLDASDYEALTGIVLDNETASTLSSDDAFFSDYVAFKGNGIELDNSDNAQDHGDALIQKLSDFYQQRHAKPMLITVSGTYSNPDSVSLAGKRNAAVQSLLINAGIPKDIVTISSPRQLEASEDASSNSGNADIETDITITAGSTCWQ
jgi:hypothetical protein